MGFEVINKIKKEKGLTNAQIAKMSGVTLSTLDKITSGLNKNPKLDTLQAICKVLGCTLNDFVDEGNQKNAPSLSDEAVALAHKYETLDSFGKNMLLTVAEKEAARVNAQQMMPADKPEVLRLKSVPLFGHSFAAGPGEPELDNAWEPYRVPADNPADFAIRITGDSMEPYLHDGQIALGVRRAPKDGEVGAFSLDGEYLCKQVCTDANGTVYLFSLNRARADMDVTIQRDSGRSLTYFGTIIMDKKPPLP